MCENYTCYETCWKLLELPHTSAGLICLLSSLTFHFLRPLPLYPRHPHSLNFLFHLTTYPLNSSPLLHSFEPRHSSPCVIFSFLTLFSYAFLTLHVPHSFARFFPPSSSSCLPHFLRPHCSSSFFTFPPFSFFVIVCARTTLIIN